VSGKRHYVKQELNKELIDSVQVSNLSHMW